MCGGRQICANQPACVVPGEVITESLFLTCRNVHEGEESDSRVPIHCPFLSLAVGLAAVVHETCLVSLRPCVNDAVLIAGKRRGSR